MKRKLKEGLSIVVPAYNEEKSIQKTINTISKIIKSNLFPIEAIFVNDCSTDKTGLILNKKINISKKIKTINNENNLGYGNSIKIGIENSKFKNIIITDADSSYPLERIPEFYKLFINSNLDMLIGDRSGSFYKYFLSYFSAKNIGREIVRLLASLLTNYKINDINSGFRIFRKEMYYKFYDFLPNGFSLTSTITCLAINFKYKIRFKKIKYSKRIGKSKIKPVRDFINFINLIIKIVIFTKPLRIFIPLFAFTFLLGIFLMILRIFFTDQFFGTSVTLIIISLLILFFGYVFELLLIIYKKNI